MKSKEWMHSSMESVVLCFTIAVMWFLQSMMNVLPTIMAVTTFVSTPWAASNVNVKLVTNFILMAKSVKVIMFLKPPPCDHHYINFYTVPTVPFQGALYSTSFSRIDLYCRCLWRVHWSSQWDYTEPLLPWPVSPQQELCLADSGPWPVSHHPQLLPLWHGGQQCMYSSTCILKKWIQHLHNFIYLCKNVPMCILMIFTDTGNFVGNTNGYIFPKLISIVKFFILDR